MCAPVTSDRAWYNSDNKAPLFEGLGDLHFPVSTKDTLAQKYINQGIILAYGFNHAEAARSFYYAPNLMLIVPWHFGAMPTYSDPTIMPVWKVITTNAPTNQFRKH
jgi:hypothetical protein